MWWPVGITPLGKLSLREHIFHTMGKLKNPRRRSPRSTSCASGRERSSFYACSMSTEDRFTSPSVWQSPTVSANCASDSLPTFGPRNSRPKSTSLKTKVTRPSMYNAPLKVRISIIKKLTANGGGLVVRHLSQSFQRASSAFLACRGRGGRRQRCNLL